ncbi:cell division protein FtsL [Acinetobacter calcoaceticus]|uniref:Cell division protein FtsL n=1 Tax=Acinetobacter calcoaceticus TaxID=471 RepID=A0A4R1Y0K9_ACICA|nr:cell division protein FtsL [Acinetobacter calcoaceticus]
MKQQHSGEQPLSGEQPAQFTLKKIVVYAILMALIIVSALMVVMQVFKYRHDFREFNSFQREREDINAEWGRLLIEQQTFGATAQIGTRAVTQLRMYSPPPAQTVVISLPTESEPKK